jgi:hypothetical protein
MEQARADELAVAQIQILCIISVSSVRMLQLFILFPGGLLSISVSCLIRNSLLAFPMFIAPPLHQDTIETADTRRLNQRPQPAQQGKVATWPSPPTIHF